MNEMTFSKRLWARCAGLFLAFAFLGLTFSPGRLNAEDNRIKKANYELAARFSPAKIDKMVFDTFVEPHWLEKSDRFWYGYKTSQGKTFFLVDPLRKTKQPLFDNVRLAAKLTELSKFPFDAQHLSIESIKFIKNDQSVQFKIEPPYEVGPPPQKEVKTEGEGKDAKKKYLYFEYELAAGKLTLLSRIIKSHPRSRNGPPFRPMKRQSSLPGATTFTSWMPRIIRRS